MDILLSSKVCHILGVSTGRVLKKKTLLLTNSTDKCVLQICTVLLEVVDEVNFPHLKFGVIGYSFQSAQVLAYNLTSL